MATCKDCLYVDVCMLYLDSVYKKNGLDASNFENLRKIKCDDCAHFKDRSRFVELPCVAGEYVYVIEPIFGKSIEHTIRRRKIKSIEPHAEIKFYGGWIHDFLSGFGRYIFSTYEEAKQALKEREENA